MNQKKKIGIIVCAILSILTYALYIYQVFEDIYNDSFYYTGFLFLWAFFGSIMFAIIFPRIFSNFYLKAKGLFLREYENGYIETEKIGFSVKIFLKRAFFFALLSIGFYTIIMESGIIDLTVLFPHSSLKMGKYDMTPFFVLSMAVFPIALGLFSISWALEDAGLIHFDLPEDQTNKLFEIEPIYVRYDSYIKGYAGLSSLFFFITMLYNYIMFYPGGVYGLGIVVFLGLFVFMFFMFPAYLVYLKMNKNNVRKNLQKYQSIKKSDLKKIP